MRRHDVVADVSVILGGRMQLWQESQQLARGREQRGYGLDIGRSGKP